VLIAGLMPYVAARLAYIGFYLVDRATLRSAGWAVGVGSTVASCVAGS
jgi:uncharacterized MAPEG superfamily protein